MAPGVPENESRLQHSYSFWFTQRNRGSVSSTPTEYEDQIKHVGSFSTVSGSAKDFLVRIFVCDERPAFGAYRWSSSGHVIVTWSDLQISLHIAMSISSSWESSQCGRYESIMESLTLPVSFSQLAESNLAHTSGRDKQEWRKVDCPAEERNLLTFVGECGELTKALNPFAFR